MWLTFRLLDLESYLRPVLRFILEDSELAAVLHHPTLNACHDDSLVHATDWYSREDVNGHLFIVSQILDCFGEIWHVLVCPLAINFVHAAASV